MAYTLGNNCANNLCKRTVLVQLIIENVVTCFWGAKNVRCFSVLMCLVLFSKDSRQSEPCSNLSIFFINVETSYFTQLKMCYLMTTFRCPSDIFIIIIIIIYESCSAKSTNENDGALHSHKTLS